MPNQKPLAMKPKKILAGITGLLVIFVLSFTLHSCSSTKAQRISTQKRGLMLQDKSDYSMNHKFKGSKSKSFKKQKKKSKKMKKRRR